ncbi:HlyD family secretion protein [Niabella pedocola]|uniref:HlyD family secretion protein n=1 Tax=Niabella pedocola TaxID=1752077 RepID=A0ABS8PUE4_9BACT|nr:HlyD family efflux transporter periplasmic adaptor subunit [Niabella pedocola]MCD2424429.1 HlyD family secretion protein [Niabella pedocola]
MSDNNAKLHEIYSQDLQHVSVNKSFDERSEVAQEIVNRKPDFYEKWALLVFLFLLLLLVTGTWFIKYPDIIQTNAVLTSYNAPKEIIANKTGKLTALFAKNNQQVREGEILGWIESNADTQEIIELSGRLDSSISMLKSVRPELIVGLFSKGFSSLGELQSNYQTFITALQQYNDYLVNGFYSKRKQLLNGDIVALQSMRNNATQQKKITSEDNELARKTFEMNEMLYKEKIISAEEYRQAQSTLLNKQKTDPQMEMNIIAQQNQIRDKQKEIDQLNHDIFQQQQTFEQALRTLKSNVDIWLKLYTIQAPADGVVIFALPVQQNQYLQTGKLLGYVNPPDNKYYAEIRLPQNNFGKVDTGMKVQLRFDAYPYQEIGFIPGTLDYVSNIAVDSSFLGTVRLDNGLNTNQHKAIQYKNGLKAQALIITKEMRLLQRLYYSIAKATSLNK